MKCIPDDLPANYSHDPYLTNGSVGLASGPSVAMERSGGGGVLLTIEMILYSRVAAIICVAGLVGNLLNVTVLTRRRLQTGG